MTIIGPEEFAAKQLDYVIVGGGTAGLVVAARLFLPFKLSVVQQSYKLTNAAMLGSARILDLTLVSLRRESLSQITLQSIFLVSPSKHFKKFITIFVLKLWS